MRMTLEWPDATLCLSQLRRGVRAGRGPGQIHFRQRRHREYPQGPVVSRRAGSFISGRPPTLSRRGGARCASSAATRLRSAWRHRRGPPRRRAYEKSHRSMRNGGIFCLADPPGPSYPEEVPRAEEATRRRHPTDPLRSPDPETRLGGRHPPGMPLDQAMASRCFFSVARTAPGPESSSRNRASILSPSPAA